MRHKEFRTRQVLTHVKQWAIQCSTDPRFKWNKADQNILILLEEEIKKINKEYYEQNKA